MGCCETGTAAPDTNRSGEPKAHRETCRSRERWFPVEQPVRPDENPRHTGSYLLGFPVPPIPNLVLEGAIIDLGLALCTISRTGTICIKFNLR